MDSVSVSGVSVRVAFIVDAFAESSRLFKRWRKSKPRKKAVGQEELETSLYDGEKVVRSRLDTLSSNHGRKFDDGDPQSLASLYKIRADFHKDLIDVLISSMARTGAEELVVDPVALRILSEATRKDTLAVMDELADRIVRVESAASSVTHPHDILPSHPLPPPRQQDSTSGSQTLDNELLVDTGYQSLATPPPFPSLETRAPKMAPPFIIPDFSSSQSLVQKLPSRSVLSRMFSTTPRPYYDIKPFEPIPAVLPSFKLNEDSSKILEQGRDHVDRLWDATHEAQNSAHPRSAPRLQFPWSEDDLSEPPSPLEATPPAQEHLSPPLVSSAIPVAQHTRPGWETGKRIRSKPLLTFSKPTPRFKRNVSGPPGGG
ncbi:hypothetical protein BJ875DRAFT_200101 [Amylocarpus encephaloides]|uniref:Uncharacterized protein n=1 Tax=Amylocarpus encephaloides TaxID=45428 RepID=A0A9P7YNQ0_9HELO|nr:hypothetical protein BJ875DRAFT_200101 [Amylocarpus encephaloides]